MTLKEEVLACLEQNRKNENSISGEQLAEKFGVSRSAVWKAIKSLRSEGYEIDAVTNKGYCLRGESDRLSKAGIGAFLKYIDPDNIYVYDETDSTNTRARELAQAGAVHGTAVFADCQTSGRGRLGRAFVSPSGSGIYMSLILRPKEDIAQAMLITTAAAAATCHAIRDVTGADAGIKWVNDIYIGQKKICGILTEAVTDFETGNLEYVIVGTGVNFKASPEEYPADVLERITWIYESEKPQVTRNRLAAAIMDETLRLCENLDDKSFLDYYRSHAIMLDKDVICIRGNESWNAHTVDIDESGGLIVRMSDGTLCTLSSGEISVRW
jgi:BirA family biotin operon repressor/biotin-[acetyl-CoA-carboxylase] ligase